jgi:hypothetical protein
VPLVLPRSQVVKGYRRMALEDRSWGYTRIQGAMANLADSTIMPSTIIRAWKTDFVSIPFLDNSRSHTVTAAIPTKREARAMLSDYAFLSSPALRWALRPRIKVSTSAPKRAR